MAVKLAQKNQCASIASTYVEPTIFFECIYDVSVLAKEKLVLSVYYSNGYINPKPLADLCRYLAAACIDLKGFIEDFYEEMMRVPSTRSSALSSNYRKKGSRRAG